VKQQSRLLVAIHKSRILILDGQPAGSCVGTATVHSLMSDLCQGIAILISSELPSGHDDRILVMREGVSPALRPQQATQEDYDGRNAIDPGMR
jgi:ABC-type sugar transport system ATPase subunit